MPKFVFSLEPVLEHRKRLEEEAQKAVAVVQMKLDECQGAMARLQTSRRASAQDLYEKLGRGMDDGERSIYANYIQLVDAELVRLRKVELEIQLELERMRRRLVEALRNREILEEVRKSEYRDYLRAENLEESKFFDDLAQRAWRTGQQQ